MRRYICLSWIKFPTIGAGLRAISEFDHSRRHHAVANEAIERVFVPRQRRPRKHLTHVPLAMAIDGRRISAPGVIL